MELNDLKSIWNKVAETDRTTYCLAETDIRHLISQKSNILFNKIARELKVKRWFMGGVSIVLIGLTLAYQFEGTGDYILDDLFSRPEMTALNLVLGFLIFILFINIVLSYRQFKAFQESAEDLKTTLHTAIKLLVRIRKLAIYSDSFAMPIIIGWAVYRKMFDEEQFVWDERILYVLLATLLSFGFIFLLSRTMQQRKFGKYIDKLKQHIADMEVLDSN